MWCIGRNIIRITLRKSTSRALLTGIYASSVKRYLSSDRKMATLSKTKQPEWIKPVNTRPPTQVQLFNSMTRTKTPLVAKAGKQLTWYNCGPTVYDVAHMGHARLYVTIDILRRVLQDYFKYDILFVMNITDIDDKIILRARQNYLFDQLKNRVDKLTQDVIDQARTAFGEFVSSKLATFDASLKTATTVMQHWETFAKKAATPESIPGATDEPKFNMYVSSANAAYKAIQVAEKALKEGHVDVERAHQLLDGVRDVLTVWLDAKHGAEVTKPEIFRELAAHWEGEFMKDMAALNVRPCDVLTRVSEYVPEIVAYVQRIIDNGYAYEADGSVYFDTRKFDGHDGHHYAKLEPWSAGSTALIEEGEGSLGAKLGGKRHPADFALWKKSKPGEPAWDSPWGRGRPGWHIECSVMASEVLGSNLDIHSGGIDLAFPHHDNELAQSEAYHKCYQWVNYFLHPGHLHIEGQKMSKSLKNFISIQEALEKYTARQIRLYFLLQPWDGPVDFKESGMEAVRSVEKTFSNFFSNVSAYMEEWRLVALQSDGHHLYGAPEKELMQLLLEKQTAVHNALADSVDTPTAMRELLELVNRANVYVANRTKPYVPLLEKIARYIAEIFKVFGLMPDDKDISFGSSEKTTTSVKETVMPYLRALSSFRDAVRNMALNKASHADLLALCDRLRDEDMLELGVVLDDREGGAALIKFGDPAQLIQERDEKRRREEEKRAKKAAAAAEKERKRLERLELGKLSPEEMFKVGEYANQFTQYDENGIPTHDAEGQELSKSRRKKLQKEWEAQRKRHTEYLAAQSDASVSKKA